MMGDFFWNVATSGPVLGFWGLVLAAALIVGYVPFGKYLPVIGPYVPAARLVVLLTAALICFLIGFRSADEREAAKSLRITLAAKQADLDNARKSAADEAARATDIETMANDQRKKDDEYIRSLEAKPACNLDDGDLGWVPNYRAKSGRSAAPPGAR